MTKNKQLTKRLFRQYINILDNNVGSIYSYNWLMAGEIDGKRVYFSMKYPTEIRAFAAYYFLKNYPSKQIDTKKLQSIILKSENPELIYKFAKNIKTSNIKRCQRTLIKIGSVKYLRLFAHNVPGCHKQYLLDLADVAEIMAKNY